MKRRTIHLAANYFCSASERIHLRTQSTEMVRRDQAVPQLGREKLKGIWGKGVGGEKNEGGIIRTDLREEEKEDGEGRQDCDETTGEGAAVEVFVHFRVGVQVPQLAP